MKRETQATTKPAARLAGKARVTGPHTTADHTQTVFGLQMVDATRPRPPPPKREGVSAHAAYAPASRCS